MYRNPFCHMYRNPDTEYNGSVIVLIVKSVYLSHPDPH